jgi:oligosaccharide reducing-end xylanase
VRAGWAGIATFAGGALLALGSACVSTTDSIGYNGPGGVHLRGLERRPTYPNPFHDLGKTDAEIADKIAGAFASLFHGDPNLQAIYVPIEPDQARIEDTLHLDVRTEGIGLAMMIAVELDKRTEFDRLWTYAATQKKQMQGARRGYFESSCDTLTPMMTMPCDDPFGEAQMLMALIFAHDRWTSSSGPVNYEAGAVDLLTVMRHKQDENGGIVDNITDTFDVTTALPFHLPVTTSAGIGRPSIVMPAYYDLWREATDDPFWTRAAVAARGYWKRTAHPVTGLTPVRATFAGAPVAYWDNFDSESYRVQLNMGLDWAWTKGAKDAWEGGEADLLLKFFSEKGINVYGAAYTLAGDPIDPMRDFALVAVNGITGMVSSNIDRGSYVTAVWDMPIPTGPARYYSGILYLTALLILSGQYQIW